MKQTGVILLVEDDKTILHTNRRRLEREGFTVLCARTVREARALLKKHSPDAMVLDVMLPDGSGVAFCEELRQVTSAPVLFLTARDEKRDVIEGLLAGGSDYISKPYDMDELLARIKVQIYLAQRKRAARCNRLQYGDLVLDLVAQRAYLNGEDLLLTQKEYSLLLLLVEARGKILSGKYLYEMIWKSPMAGDNRTLKKHLSTVRKKLEDREGGYTIRAVYGKGYYLEKLV
ncbi:response regulator transcription factor [Ihubacter massiliensis]|uniref:Stage 0 sporulation protein A homolog n=1 Tax=Hominibacterium faecale TaxID=2839743 RepID=A0A9J6QX46_9FIRM|nr:MULTISPECIES: response regulator transcription factor [Eubacteriales Family XIII. Incertae Sedis]MCO7120768.1 response regulator transcription factor [Ihubacter massiliensis]MCU7380069.1 response regulator transcription factor [Hominibacterium faecale]